MSDSKTGVNGKQTNPTNAVQNAGRRQFFKDAAAVASTAALFSAVRAAFPAGAFAGTGGAPEVKGATLGFIALTDAAPLFVAADKGIFAKYGLPDVKVVKQASWGATRDNLELGGAAGGIDGAHILTPMPYLISSGRVTKNNVKVPMNILARLNYNGQSISVSKTWKSLGATVNSAPLKEAFAKAKAGGKDIKAANTFPGGTHDMWIRYWLASGGIDPDKDIATITVPPPQMVANMKVDAMECFCVCEPWNLQLIHQEIGYTACSTGDLWGDHPEKSFAMRADWVEKYPNAAKAMLMAVMEAQQWCEDPKNVLENCQIMAKRDWIKAPVEDILDRAKGKWDYGDGRVVENHPKMMKYWRDFASYPFQSHDLWFLTENIRWGYQPADLDAAALIRQVNREDLWRDAAKELGVPAEQIPASTSRGVETFFDGKTFDPADPSAYLKSLAIKRV